MIEYDHGLWPQLCEEWGQLNHLTRTEQELRGLALRGRNFPQPLVDQLKRELFGPDRLFPLANPTPGERELIRRYT